MKYFSKNKKILKTFLKVKNVINNKYILWRPRFLKPLNENKIICHYTIIKNDFTHSYYKSSSLFLHWVIFIFYNQ